MIIKLAMAMGPWHASAAIVLPGTWPKLCLEGRGYSDTSLGVNSGLISGHAAWPCNCRLKCPLE